MASTIGQMGKPKTNTRTRMSKQYIGGCIKMTTRRVTGKLMIANRIMTGRSGSSSRA